MLPTFPVLRAYGYWPESEAAQYVPAITETFKPTLCLKSQSRPYWDLVKENDALQATGRELAAKNAELQEQLTKANAQIKKLKESVRVQEMLTRDARQPKGKTVVETLSDPDRLLYEAEIEHLLHQLHRSSRPNNKPHDHRNL